MIQEYLFVSDENKNNILGQTYEGVKMNYASIGDGKGWIVTYQIDSNSLKSARVLSEVDGFISQYSPIVLINGSAEYFNRQLFPLVNSFERKLRTLLYVSGTLNKDVKGADNITALEEMDFGTLFDLLFTDENYIRQVKTTVNDKNRKYTKQEILNDLSEIEEDVLWDRLLGASSVPTLRSEFMQIRYRRNDVMHAHNISYAAFQETKKQFEKVNSELDECIVALNVGNTDSSVFEGLQTYNEMLTKALTDFEGAKKSLSVLSDFYQRTRKNYSPSFNSALELMSSARNSAFSTQAISQALQSEEWLNFATLLDSLKTE